MKKQKKKKSQNIQFLFLFQEEKVTFKYYLNYFFFHRGISFLFHLSPFFKRGSVFFFLLFAVVEEKWRAGTRQRLTWRLPSPFTTLIYTHRETLRQPEHFKMLVKTISATSKVICNTVNFP